MKNNKKIITVILIFFIVILIFGNKGYKSTVKEYVTASMDGDGRKIVNLMPKQYVKFAIAQSSYSNKSEMIDNYTDTLNQTIESFDEAFGNGWKYKYNITDVYKYNDSDIEGFINISNYGYLLPKIKAIREVSYDLCVYSNDYESTTTERILLIKLGRKWFVADVYN